MKIYLILVLLLIIVSCNDNPIAPISKGGFIRLTEGNNWVYERLEYTDNLNDTNKKYIDTVFAIQSDSTGWYFLKNAFLFSDIYRYQIRRDGVYYMTFDYFSGQYKDYLLFQYPPIQNDSYSVGPIFEMKVININIRINVPAGNFNCINYTYVSKALKSKINFYISPNIGLIMTEMYKVNDKNIYNLVQTQKLLSYSIEN
jgi:hypothetical protein